MRQRQKNTEYKNTSGSYILHMIGALTMRIFYVILMPKLKEKVYLGKLWKIQST